MCCMWVYYEYYKLKTINVHTTIDNEIVDTLLNLYDHLHQKGNKISNDVYERYKQIKKGEQNNSIKQH